MTPTTLPAALERRVLKAPLIFEAVDAFARGRRVRGERPRPLGSLRFTLLGWMANGVRNGFERPFELAVVRNPSGYYLFLGEIKAGGERRRFDLAAFLADEDAPVSVIVRVESDFYQVAEAADVRLGERHSFELAPGFAYPFPRESALGLSRPPTLLRGRLRASDGSGIAGATVAVSGQSNTYRTDESGQWVLVFPDDPPPLSPATLRFTFVGAAAAAAGDVIVDPGRTNGFQQAALAGFVLGTSGVPLRGARISVSGHPGETVSAGDGSFTYYFPVEAFPPSRPAGPVDVRADFNGRRLVEPGVPVTPRRTSTVPTFRFQL